MTTLLDPEVTTTTTYHEELRDQLRQLTESLIMAVADGAPHAAAQRRLAEFLRSELLPHTEVETGVLYRAAGAGPTALLAAAMRDLHPLFATLARVVVRTTHPLDVAVAAGALQVLFDVRVLLENEHLLPALAAADADLATLLHDAPEVTGNAFLNRE